MEKLHPGARWLFRLGGILIVIVLSLFLGWFILPAFAIFSSIVLNVNPLYTILLSFVMYIILAIIFIEVYARMSYNRWFYEFNQSGLKLERGIIWKRYSNVPYERIQNVDVHRGIIARIFGFSTIMVQTAGYSAHPRSEGHIPAVSKAKAEHIRNFVMKKITSKK